MDFHPENLSGKFSRDIAGVVLATMSMDAYRQMVLVCPLSSDRAMRVSREHR
jgi:hypothetical protein